MSIRAINWARKTCSAFGVPAQHRLALFALCFFHNDKTGECFPSYDSIATDIGYGRRKTIDLVRDLEANGLVMIQTRRAGGHQGSNQYVLFGKPIGRKWADRVN
ncbi:helix-turn-helix domain-containing protein, partial [Cereibacter sphaeroides]